MASETFISEFHNIEGVLVGERKHNLHRLLKNKDITGDGKHLILDNLKPKTFLENLLYTDVLIYLRKTVPLLEILRYGNEVCVSKIIKQPWFFKEAFDNVGAEEFVTEVLPSMSFSVKMKVLKKLSIVFPEEKMDEVFDAVLKRYGLFIATTVIPACSPQKIEYILRNNEVKLWTSQLKIIYNKQPDLIKLYLDVRKLQNSDSIFDKKFLIYLSQNDPTLFWYILENHEMKDNLKLGHRSTKKLMEIKRNEIVSEPKKYIRYFRQETLVRNLNKLGEFKQFYHNLFPRNVEKLSSENVLCKKILKYYPKRCQYQLYTETLANVLNEDIWANLSCLNDDFLTFIPDVKLRETIAQMKYSKNNDDEYIKYYNMGRCVTLIKEKINLTSSIKERRKLLCILVKSCAINKDLKALEGALKYFCERHIKDGFSTRTDFLSTIESDIKLEELDETHWKYLKEIFTIQSLNNKGYTSHSKLKAVYIKYLYKNNRPEDDINYSILEYLKQVVCLGEFQVLSDLKDYEIEKRVLMQALEYFPILIKAQNKDDSTRRYFLSVVMAEIFSYNLRHPKNVIVISDNLMNTFRDILVDNYTSWSFVEKLSKAVCKLNRNNLENEMLTYYWEEILPQYTIDVACKYMVIRWYLKHDPPVILENIDKIFKTSLFITSKIWRRVKLYSHLNLDEIVVKYCLKQLDDAEEEDKSETIRRLSILTTAEQYIRIMENGNFIPTHPKLRIEGEEEKKIHKTQRAFLRNLPSLQDPLKYLPLLVDTFCKGDYLQWSLTALYYAFYKCPENDLKPYLNKLLNDPAISVKKHALTFACCIFEQKIIFDILNALEKNGKNSSLQKSMFSSCLRYFSKNPTEELFEKVVFHMSFLGKYDKESLKMLYTINIPRSYKPPYIQQTINLLEKLKENSEDGKSVEFDNVISSVLDITDKHCIQALPQVCCTEIIQKYFLMNYDIPGIFSFVIKLLEYRMERSINFDFVFKLLSNYKFQYWHDYSMIEQRENIYTFFKTFYEKACKAETTLDFVEQFYNNWGKIFTPIETLKEYVLLNLLRFKKESENNPEEYSKKIVLYSEKLVEEFGQIVLPKFITFFDKSLNCKPIEKINVLSNMLKFSTTALNCIIVIELIALKQDLFYEDKIRHMYRHIDSILKAVIDPDVQLYYNLYLKK